MEPTDKLEVSLDAQTWNTVLATIAKAPVAYEVTAPLIAEITRQCNIAQQPRPTLVETTAAE